MARYHDSTEKKSLAIVNQNPVSAITYRGEILSRIALKDVEAGMQLSRPVLYDAGAMLIDRGARISEEMIQKLVNADIRYIFVVGRPDDCPLDEMLSALDARFAKTKDEPHMDRLRQLMREHLQELYS